MIKDFIRLPEVPYQLKQTENIPKIRSILRSFDLTNKISLFFGSDDFKPFFYSDLHNEQLFTVSVLIKTQHHYVGSVVLTLLIEEQ